MIQKNIFQTFSKKNIPSKVNEVIDSLKHINPDYVYYFFDENDRHDFVNTNYGQDIRIAYESLQINAAKADFWRYLVLYKIGGIYIDIDSEVNKPFKDFLNEDDAALITREHNKGTFVQWALFFQKEHPLLEKLIKHVASNILWIKNNQITVHDPLELFRITGPGAFSYAVEEIYKNDKTDETVYNTSDNLLNKKTNIITRKDSARFLGIDYNNNCSFKHQYAELLEKTPWTQTIQTIPLVKL